MRIPPLTRLRIFVSSTIDDLRAERAAVDNGLTELGVFEVVRAEALPADANSSEDVCLSQAAAADALVLLVGSRYGSIPRESNPDSLSVTHQEVRRAREAGVPIFAFVRNGTDRDPQAAEFLREIGNFSDGIFWKEWSQAADLAHEVRRALVNWLAREARGESWRSRKPGIAVERVLAAADAVEPILITVDGGGQVLRIDDGDWSAQLVQSIDRFARSHVIPARVHVKTGASEPHSIHVSLKPRADGRISCAVSSSDVQEWTLTADLPQTVRGAQGLVHLVGAAAFLRGEDAPRGIFNLLELARHPDFEPVARTALLQRAALESAAHQGEGALGIARVVIRDHIVDDNLTQALSLALLNAQRKFENGGARTASNEAATMHVQILVMALEAGGARADVLYSLARANLGGPAAFKFYQHLLLQFPEYDARWYVHRDIGLVYYAGNRYADAAVEYQKALRLKGDDAELARFAGDALFYDGRWASAHRLYQTALDADSTQDYFVADKVRYILWQIRRGKGENRQFARRRRRSERITLFLSWLETHECPAPVWVYRVAFRMCAINASASMELALRASRRGSYSTAIGYLRLQLAAVPENPKARLNLVSDLIYLAGGEFTAEAQDEFRRAAFHGGVQTVQELKTRLLNTSSGPEIIRQLPPILETARVDFELHAKRLRDARVPERIGTTLHIEL